MISGVLFERQVRNTLEVIFDNVAERGDFVGKWTNLVEKPIRGGSANTPGVPLIQERGAFSEIGGKQVREFRTCT